ncbi:unnamed protein product, partial [Pylaiella littoralis]
QQAVQHNLKPGNFGPSTLDFLIRKFAAAWNLTDDQAGIDRIRRFGVPSGTLYKEYLRYFKALVTTVLQSHSLYTPQSSQVQLAVRDSILKQFPGMASDMISPEMFVSASPWGTGDASIPYMWEQLDDPRRANIAAVSGDSFFALPSHASKNTSATSRALASVSGSSASPNSSWQTGVMNIDTPRDDTDPFEQSYAAWPL